jgi:hypothetical protein
LKAAMAAMVKTATITLMHRRLEQMGQQMVGFKCPCMAQEPPGGIPAQLAMQPRLIRRWGSKQQLQDLSALQVDKAAMEAME